MRITVIPIVQGSMRIKWVTKGNTVSFKLVFIFFNWVFTGFQAHKFLWASVLRGRAHWGPQGCILASASLHTLDSGLISYPWCLFLLLPHSRTVTSHSRTVTSHSKHWKPGLQSWDSPKKEMFPKQRAQLPAVYSHKPGTRGKKETYLFS